MTIEEALKNILSNIEALSDNIYPLSVPEKTPPPYIAYSLADGKYLKCLDGSIPWELVYEINIMSESYKMLKQIEVEVHNTLKLLLGKQTTDGKVKEIIIGVPIEDYEEKVDLQRANIQLTIYF